MGLFKKEVKKDVVVMKRISKNLTKEERLIKEHEAQLEYIKDCEEYARLIYDRALSAFTEKKGWKKAFFKKFKNERLELLVLERRVDDIKFNLEYYEMREDPKVVEEYKNKAEYMKRRAYDESFKDESYKNSVVSYIRRIERFISPGYGYSSTTINL